jgi:hypothetical protein
MEERLTKLEDQRGATVEKGGSFVRRRKLRRSSIVICGTTSKIKCVGGETETVKTGNRQRSKQGNREPTTKSIKQTSKSVMAQPALWSSSETYYPIIIYM